MGKRSMREYEKNRLKIIAKCICSFSIASSTTAVEGRVLRSRCVLKLAVGM